MSYYVGSTHGVDRFENIIHFSIKKNVQHMILELFVDIIVVKRRSSSFKSNIQLT